MFTTELALVQNLLADLTPVANIVGPAYGAACCDKANAVANAVYILGLRMADADGVDVPHFPKVPPRPGETPTGRVKGRLTALSGPEHLAVVQTLRATDRTLVTLQGAFELIKPQRGIVVAGRAARKRLATLCAALDRDPTPSGFQAVNPANEIRAAVARLQPEE